MVVLAEPYIPMALQNYYGTYDVITDQGQTLTTSVREVSSGDTETLRDMFS